MSPMRYVVDTSALTRLLRDPAIRGTWSEQIQAGLVGICPLIELELLYTARSKNHREQTLSLLHSAFPWLPMPDRIYHEATEVQAALTATGTHRSAGAVDLLVAATARLHGLTLLHYDHDFDQIAAVTGQPMMWLADPGALD